MSKKHAYYFPHFLNARNDSKILKLRRVLGLEGYSIYFMLLEVLREQSDMKYPLEGLSELEFDFRISREKIATVIHDYDLFAVDENSNFFSKKLNDYMQPFIEKGERARLAALKKWELERGKSDDANADANASKLLADANAPTNADAKAYPEGMQKHTLNGAKADAFADANKQTNKQTNKESKEAPAFFPDKSLHSADLDQDDFDNTIVYVETTSQKKIEPREVDRMWKAFKIQYFNGNHGYDDWIDVVQHFRDWLKNQLINNKTAKAEEQPVKLLDGRKFFPPMKN